jgi:hypothetical protein
VFEGLLPNRQLMCWHYHVEYLEGLRQLEVTKKDLDKTLRVMEKAHLLMYNLYRNVEIQAETRYVGLLQLFFIQGCIVFVLQ